MDKKLKKSICGMTLIVSLSLVPVLGVVAEMSSNDADSGTYQHTRKKKRLLSSLLFMKALAPPRGFPFSRNSLTVTGEPERRYPPSLFRSVKAQERAVRALYEQHGYNRAVSLNLRDFSTHKYSFMKRLTRSGRYIHAMAGIFSERGLPRELAYLPLIESEFNPYAFSGKRATGPWQFVPATARRLNLKMDWWVDERRDPIKSTEAAAVYMKYLYERFGTWNLALAAYNAGEGRVGRALDMAGARDFWSLRSTGVLARETENYVPAYIAATAIALAPGQFGFPEIRYHDPFEFDEVIVDTPMDLEVAARLAGTDTVNIRDLNPELRRLCTPPNVDSYSLRIPRGTKTRFLSNLEKTRKNEVAYVNFYQVKQGDTITKIARQLGTTMEAIMEMNDLGTRALVEAGRHLLVPRERKWERVLQ
ncbi:MAG: transglycosylase SLT domain-containing protein [Nitrospiraceae bacterium]|nr:MAG: transglycosylase SLT domain-containing protein [Nitrospiraceae bacterium]